MAFEAETELETPAVKLKTCLAEGPWGELWRADRVGKAGTVIVALYDGPEAAAAWQRDNALLVHWARSAGSDHTLAMPSERGTGPQGFFLFEFGDAKTLRELVLAAEPRGLDLKTVALMADKIAHALEVIGIDGAEPLGLNPDRIVRLGDGSWRILPYAFATPTNVNLAGPETYLPPEMPTTPEPKGRHFDFFGLSYIAAGALRGSFPKTPTEDVLKNLSYPEFAQILRNNAKPVHGNYTEGNIAARAFDFYVKKELAKDLAEHNEIEADSHRTPTGKFLHHNRDLLLRLGKAALIVGAVVGAALLVPKMFTTKGDDSTPRGVSSLFFDAIKSDNLIKAKTFTEGGATNATGHLAEAIKRMHAEGLASPFAGASVTHGDATVSPLQAKATLTGTSGDPFMTVEYVVERRDKVWRITSILFEPLRKKEQGP